MAKLPDGMITFFKGKKAEIVLEQKELIMCKNCYFFQIECNVCIAWGCGTNEDGWCYQAEKKVEDDD